MDVLNRDRQLAAEKAEKERIELEKKREKELALKKEMERVKEQVGGKLCLRNSHSIHIKI
ncbi:hypothetical protein DPMN_053185 [Dreissena polymorpha]|uniref:Uncharacterized protein n=1 Tax=Dreissena polymorpha TaxID=45954 RepID=A0A9D4HQH2_DREPO|nr:hypothetical protein DPMN_053185 [Dreissena polymorpha]